MVSYDLTVPEIFEAYYDCRKTKRNTANALLFEENLEQNLLELYEDLVNQTYYPGKSICFVVHSPKVREVWAADFRDRVVHHAFYNRYAEGIIKSFIGDSYACIPGRGTHAAVTKIDRNVRSITQNHTQEGYVLKMDIANYFASIDRDILDEQLSRHITDPWWVWLYKTILHHDPTQNVFVRSSQALMKRVPAHKSLFNSNGKGLPIGNLSSQLFGNVYLNDLDQYAKHELKIKHYVRYVDDILVVGKCSKELAKLVKPIDSFLGDKLRLRLHPNKISINKIEHGFDALGYVVRPYTKYIRRSTLKRGIHTLKDMCEAKAHPHEIMATANSYFALLRRANSWRERERLADLLRSHGHLVSPKLTRMFKGIVE